MAQCGTCVSRLYKSVIEEVISGVKEAFLDEGIDEQVLTDLKQQWESKLSTTKAAEHSELTQQHQYEQQVAQGPPQSQSTTAATVQAVALVPIQITIPAQQSGGTAKTITIHAPSSALAAGIAGPQLQHILSSPAAAQTFALETSQAAEIIQRQLNSALQQNGVTLPPQLLQYNNSSVQVDGPADQSLRPAAVQLPDVPSTSKKRSPESGPSSFDVKVQASAEEMDKILCQGLRSTQTDGAHGLGDSSDEMTDDDEDDDDEDNDEDRKPKDEDDEEVEDEEEDAWNEDPLNSDDDVSDDDATDVFETDNVVVCQYDKITRVRNKWKFHLKDGIMNLKSKDYVFTKASGEGEW